MSQSTPKRINLSIEGKREILREYDALPKMSQESAANLLKVPRMSLRNILSKREEIIAAPKSDKKRSRVGKDAMVENYPETNKRFVCDECGYSSNIKNRLVDHVH